MILIFGASLFLSACLLFFVQPMIGKMLLPLFGGVISVWNICLVFFQLLLLAGYVYGHALVKFLNFKKQAAVHTAVLILPLFFLPIVISSEILSLFPSSGNPSIQLLRTLFITAALPFFAVSSCAVVFQKWFSMTNHIHARDPYFLYASSNAGSLTGLLLYPLVLEPLFNIQIQASLWHAGYFLLTLFCLVCVYLVFKSSLKPQYEKINTIRSDPPAAEKLLTVKRRLWWTVLAFIPSSLMMGLTAYITTDIAAVPLIWVMPLALYLLSFIFVFARKPVYAPWIMNRAMCGGAVILTAAFLSGATQPALLLIIIHIAFFFTAALVAHTRLAKDRPHASCLTEYYLWIAVGGALGGIFNALLAPLIFTRVFEYILVIVLACAVRQAKKEELLKGSRRQAAAVYILVVLSVILTGGLTEYFNLSQSLYMPLIIFGLPVVLAYTLVSHPRRFALGLFILILTGSLYTNIYRKPVYITRNFYGVIKVEDNKEKGFRNLIDGITIHGREKLQKDNDEPRALTYYYPTGPAGEAFKEYQRRERKPEDTSRVALIGLGIGSLADYGRPQEHWDFFELNPAVIKTAMNPEYFTIISNSRAGSYSAVPGDGRVNLAAKPDKYYDIIVIDAFSSGSIPVHLLTKEAVELYMDKLSADGIVMFHISNRLLNLKPALEDIAAYLSIPGYVVTDTFLSQKEEEEGKEPSEWVFLAKRSGRLNFLKTRRGAFAFSSVPQNRVWTDSFSNILLPLFSRR